MRVRGRSTFAGGGDAVLSGRRVPVGRRRGFYRTVGVFLFFVGSVGRSCCYLLFLEMCCQGTLGVASWDASVGAGECLPCMCVCV